MKEVSSDEKSEENGKKGKFQKNGKIEEKFLERVNFF